MKVIELLLVLIVVGFGQIAYSAQAKLPTSPNIPRIKVPINTPIIFVKPNSLQTLPRLDKSTIEAPKQVPIQEPIQVIIPEGAFIIEPPPPHVTDENKDCNVSEIECADKNCSPLPKSFSSYRACIKAQCEIEEDDCVTALVKRLKERAQAKRKTKKQN